MTTGTATLNTNTLNANAAQITISSETTISLYVVAKTGAEGSYRVSLEVSPDAGTTWLEAGSTLSKPGIITCKCATTRARAKVSVAQGATSTVTVHVVAL